MSQIIHPATAKRTASTKKGISSGRGQLIATKYSAKAATRKKNPSPSTAITFTTKPPFTRFFSGVVYQTCATFGPFYGLYGAILPPIDLLVQARYNSFQQLTSWQVETSPNCLVTTSKRTSVREVNWP